MVAGVDDGSTVKKFTPTLNFQIVSEFRDSIQPGTLSTIVDSPLELEPQSGKNPTNASHTV
jgi:hypothetical protein